MVTALPYYRETLKNELETRVKKNPRYSLRAFATALEIEPSALSKILSGKRMMTKKMADRFFRVLDLSPAEKQKFLFSALLAKDKSVVQPDQSALFRLLQQQAPHTIQDLSIDVFTAISEWYYYAILEATHIEGFEPNAKWISSALGISHSTALIAIERLFKLELLVDEGGRWKKSTQWITLPDKTVTSSAHRKRQKQVLTKSMEALENVPIEARNHSGITIPADPAKIEEARKMIQEFTRKLGAFLSTGKTHAVYELNINLFPLTKD